MTNKEQAKRELLVIKSIKKGEHETAAFFVDFYYREMNGKLYIYCEETRQKFDWITDFLAMPVKVTLGGITRKYHCGFYYTAITIYSRLRKVINSYDSCIIYGYSLGGGSAEILNDIIQNMSKCYVEEVITLGTPKNLMLSFNKSLKKERERCVRYIQGNDIVSWIVPFPYIHWSKSLKFKGTGNIFKDHEYRNI